MELALAGCGAVWMLVVPGLPLTLLLARRGWTWWEVGALSPLPSIGATFGLLQAVNRLGLKPDLRLFGWSLTVFAAAATWWLLRNRPGLERPPAALAGVLLPVTVALLLWSAALRGYALLAGNADAVNHNLWIARMMAGGSVLGSDVRVASPLQEHVAGAGFYPLAWHAETATAASLFGVPAPTMSLVSTFVFWSVVLSAGLVCLARCISQCGVLLGLTAAVLAQTVPLVPGVPMTWGAMTSVIGVAMLPAAMFTVIELYEDPGWRSIGLFVFVEATLFFAHSPEAATIAVIVGAAAVVQGVRGRLARRTAMLFGGLGGLALLAVLALPSVRALWGTLSGLLGGNDRGINESLGSFLTLSVNVPSTQIGFGLLVLVGAWLAASVLRGPWLAVAVGSILAVYLVAGANSEPLVRFRRLTAPWYGSYERTAWVAVPFLAILAALPVVALALRARDRGWGSVAPLALASLLVVAQGWLGGQATAMELRKGVAENQVAGPGSRTVFDESRRRATSGGILLSEPGDGSIYAYVYDGVPVTNGAYDRRGEVSPDLQAVLTGVHDLCAVPMVADVLQREHVVGLLVGTRATASEAPRWTDSELSSLRGLRVVSRSRDLFLLEPEVQTCR